MFYLLSAFFGFIGIIMYGSAASKISYKLSWSFALVIHGLLANLTAGVFIHIASQRFKAVRLFDTPLPPGKIHPLPFRDRTLTGWCYRKNIKFYHSEWVAFFNTKIYIGASSHKIGSLTKWRYVPVGYYVCTKEGTNLSSISSQRFSCM